MDEKDIKDGIVDGFGYFREDGKRWYKSHDTYYRAHDDDFNGMRFRHKRCPICNRITSVHTLHWLNHMNKCADPKYSNSELMEMQHKKPKDFEAKGKIWLGR